MSDDLLFVQSGLEKNLFGNHPVSFGTEPRSPPPAFTSEPLHPAVVNDAASTATGFTRPASLDIVEIEGPTSATSSLANHEPNFMKSTSPTGVRSLIFLFCGIECLLSLFLQLSGYFFVVSHTWCCSAFCHHTEECNTSRKAELRGSVLC